MDHEIFCRRPLIGSFCKWLISMRLICLEDQHLPHHKCKHYLLNQEPLSTAEKFVCFLLVHLVLLSLYGGHKGGLPLPVTRHRCLKLQNTPLNSYSPPEVLPCLPAKCRSLCMLNDCLELKILNGKYALNCLLPKSLFSLMVIKCITVSLFSCF